MRKWLEHRFGVRRPQGGQTTAEYAIIVTLVALTSIAVILIFGNQIRAVFAAGAQKLAGDGETTVQVEDKSTDADKIEGKMNEF